MLEPKRLTMSIPQFAKTVGISKTLAYELARTGQIPVIKLGAKRIVVPITAVEKMLDCK